MTQLFVNQGLQTSRCGDAINALVIDEQRRHTFDLAVLAFGHIFPNHFSEAVLLKRLPKATHV